MWLEREVFKATIDWDQLLNITKGCTMLSAVGDTKGKIGQIDANQNNLITKLIGRT